jgi:hypothetical protein
LAHNGVLVAGGGLTDWISLGMLAPSVPRDAVDAAVVAARAAGEFLRAERSYRS